MNAHQRLTVALCWQMPVPGEADDDSGPETSVRALLHGIGIFTDVAAELEQVEDARALLLLCPRVLLSLEASARQIRRHLDAGAPLGLPLLGLLAEPVLAPQQREDVVTHCLGADPGTLMTRYPGCRDVMKLADHARHRPDVLYLLDDSFFRDLVMWRYLGALGASVRRDDPRVQSLAGRPNGFDPTDHRALLSVIGEQLAELVPRLRTLLDTGRVEAGLLSDAVHPAEICADLVSFEAALGRAPHVYWQRGRGLDRRRLRFLAERGIRCVGGAVDCRRSGRSSGREAAATGLARVDSDPLLLEREEVLCLLIEQSYPEWPAEDAVDNCLRRLESIADRRAGQPAAPVAIAIGEGGVWDRFADGGAEFRRRLYLRLAHHPRLRPGTAGDAFYPPAGWASPDQRRGPRPGSRTPPET